MTKRSDISWRAALFLSILLLGIYRLADKQERKAADNLRFQPLGMSLGSSMSLAERRRIAEKDLSCHASARHNISGYLQYGQEEYILIQEKDKPEPVKLSLKNSTLYLEIKVDRYARELSEREIKRSEINIGDSIASETYNDQDDPDRIYALIVKKIVFPN